jgi:prephenate dehydrogenase
LKWVLLKLSYAKQSQTIPKEGIYIATHQLQVEFSGPSAAWSGLFQGKTNIICEVEPLSNYRKKSIGSFKAIG